MNKPKKIYVVACLHGDELFGLKIVARLRAINSRHVTTAIAHPEAIAKRRRSIDTDLNRSFHPDALPSKEAAIARHIRQEIDQLNPDLIIDLHNVECPVGAVAILAHDSDELLRLGSQIGMDQAVVMPGHIAKDSLIGSYPERALSIEFGIGLRSDKLAQAVAQAIADISNGELNMTPVVMPTYYVTRKIANDEAPSEALTNYKYHRGLQGYPFLVGKDSYPDYRGFLAPKHSLRQVAISN